MRLESSDDARVMANLTIREKRDLESYLAMSGGYVLDFSNRTFGDFILDCTGRSIYSGTYDGMGDSKANHLRCFWKLETEQTVGKLIRRTRRIQHQ